MSVGVKVRTGDIRVLLKIVLAFGKSFFNVAPELVFHRIIPHNISTAEIRLPLFEHGSEIEKYDVIFQDAVYVNPRIDITDKVIKSLNSAAAPTK